MIDLKVDFIDEEHFTIYYLSDNLFRTEEELKILFKMMNQQLKKQYDYEFRGFYNVVIYCNGNAFVMEFENIDDYGTTDFNITMLLNSVLLYEFEDSDILLEEKIYHDYKYYVELERMNTDIHLFEYGNIVYGKKVERILNEGILICI